MPSPTAPPFAFTPVCRATTASSFCAPTQRRSTATDASPRSNLFRHAQFSPDGTAVVTHSEDQCLRSFILPQDLLEDHDESQYLEAYSCFASPTNIQSLAIHPHFHLQDPSSTLVLSASAHVPLTLRNALQFDTVHAHYPFENALNEEHRSANALTFTRDGSHFIAGSANLLAVFDCERYAEGPVAEYKLRQGKRAPQTDSWHLTRRGIVSAAMISSEGCLAIGTTQSEIALYTDDGLGSCISTFALDSDSGSGVTGLKWSPDGQYLLVAQRQSDLIDVYDTRNLQQKVASLIGRNAKTPQRLDIDVVATLAGYELWAGGTDGIVRMWSNPGASAGALESDAQLQFHEAPVSSTIWHPTGAVLATCSGKRFEHLEDYASDSDADGSIHGVNPAEQSMDNTLKIWSL